MKMENGIFDTLELVKDHLTENIEGGGERGEE